MWNNLTNDVDNTHWKRAWILAFNSTFTGPLKSKKKKIRQYNNKTKFIKDNITLLDYFPLSPHLLIPFISTDIHVYTMPFLVDISLLLNQQSSYSWNM
jgi:hypothetical protein